MKKLAATVAETKAITGLGVTKIYELLNSGQLESVHIGQRRLILISSIERLLGISPEAAPEAEAA